MRIGIDIDGVLTDFEKWQLDYGSKYFLKYNKNIVNPDGYDSDTVFNVTNEMDSEFWKEYLYEYAINDTFNDGKDAVNNLSDKELLSEFKEIE